MNSVVDQVVWGAYWVLSFVLFYLRCSDECVWVVNKDEVMISDNIRVWPLHSSHRLFTLQAARLLYFCVLWQHIQIMTETNAYFDYSWFVSFNRLIYKMPRNLRKMITRARGDVFKLLLFAEQHPLSLGLIYNYGKSENCHILVVGTS